MSTQENAQQNKKNNTRLLLRFLKGSKLLFVLSIACSALVTFVDMVNPQIIRAAIDNAIGGQPSQFPAWVNGLVEKAGGFAYLGQHLYLMALAIAALALVRACAQYGTTMLNTRASEVFVKNMRKYGKDNKDKWESLTTEVLVEVINETKSSYRSQKEKLDKMLDRLKKLDAKNAS